MVEKPVLATLTQRLVGQIADGAVAIMLVVILVEAAVLTGVRTLIFVAIGGAFLYILFSDGFENGQSLGKRLVRTRVVDFETGAPCTFGQSFVRNLTGFAAVFDWVFIFGENRQRLGDRAAGTIVVIQEGGFGAHPPDGSI